MKNASPMLFRRHKQWLRPLCLLACFALCGMASASEYHGLVKFAGLPLPGATVTASQGDKKLTAITDQQGFYSFPDLADGKWTIQIEMLCFATVKQDVTVAANAPMAESELKLLPLDQIHAQVIVATAAPAPPPPALVPAAKAAPKPAAGNAPAAPAPEPPADENAQRAADGLLVNGSVVNGATSPFAQAAAFGNNRNGGRSLYQYGLSFNLNTAALDARQYSTAGVESPKLDFNDITGIASIGGPIRIPHVLRNGPNFFVQYTWTRNSNANTSTVLVPDAAERLGDFSHEVNAAGQPIVVYNPATGQPYTGDKVPISSPAQALLNLFPQPNITGNPKYNFQIPILNSTHVDALTSRLNKSFGFKNQFYGTFNYQSSRSSNNSLFGFNDITRSFGLNASVNWAHSFTQRFRMDNLTYTFSRQSTTVIPYWQNRSNVSGNAGIGGNLQDTTDWGPPALGFSGSSGVTSLSDGNASHNRPETNAGSILFEWNHYAHNLKFGADYRRQEFNYLAQSNPRGNFTFTGTATANGAAIGSGSDFADFLIGVPDASAIAYGNADKYLRESVYDASVNDDWRVNPELTLNGGIRWEYSAPITELKDRLVNLDVSPGFAATSQVLAGSPTGPLTGQHYPDSLIRPYKMSIQPKFGLSWRPVAGSSMVIAAGYSWNQDTSIYQTIALAMAQQAPLSKSLNVQNSAACPLTLANGFGNCPAVTDNTFAVDPNLRPGYVQTWQLSVRRDLPWAMQMNATYLGNKGTHGMQNFYPNSYPAGGTNPCPSCPSGFSYLTSGGNSTRDAGSLQLRRRLHNGFTATATYTFAKSLDDDAVLGGQGGGNSLPAAQDWRNLAGERGLSSIDQRHLLVGSMQYTSGMGIGGGSLMDGWRGRVLKEWSALVSVSAGSGLPLTPYTSGIISGTGAPGFIRPDLTGASIYAAPAGLYLNPAAYAAPAAGQWGNARRNSITGPNQFSLNGSLNRNFRLKDRWNLTTEIDATNMLNHVVFGSYINNITDTQFGLPTGPNAMRSVIIKLSLRN